MVRSLPKPVCAGCGQWPGWPAALVQWPEHIRGGRSPDHWPKSTFFTFTFTFMSVRMIHVVGLCIPSNNTIFIKSVSERLAVNEPHLTLEFLEECIQGFRASNIEMKHLCLEYMTPWLPNLTRSESLAFIWHSFLDQELISYRYSSCRCCWDDCSWTRSKNPKAPSFQIGLGWNLAGLFFK